jgi:hypothetical protein
VDPVQYSAPPPPAAAEFSLHETPVSVIDAFRAISAPPPVPFAVLLVNVVLCTMAWAALSTDSAPPDSWAAQDAKLELETTAVTEPPDIIMAPPLPSV